VVECCRLSFAFLTLFSQLRSKRAEWTRNGVHPDLADAKATPVFPLRFYALEEAAAEEKVPSNRQAVSVTLSSQLDAGLEEYLVPFLRGGGLLCCLVVRVICFACCLLSFDSLGFVG
jgi:hypothetical protein